MANIYLKFAVSGESSFCVVLLQYNNNVVEYAS